MEMEMEVEMEMGRKKKRRNEKGKKEKGKEGKRERGGRCAGSSAKRAPQDKEGETDQTVRQARASKQMRQSQKLIWSSGSLVVWS